MTERLHLSETVERVFREFHRGLSVDMHASALEGSVCRIVEVNDEGSSEDELWIDMDCGKYYVHIAVQRLFGMVNLVAYVGKKEEVGE